MSLLENFEDTSRQNLLPIRQPSNEFDFFDKRFTFVFVALEGASLSFARATAG